MSGNWRIIFRFENADAPQIAVALGIVEPVSDDKLVGDLKPDQIDPEFDFATRTLLEQNTRPERSGIHLLNIFDNPCNGMAGIENVIDEEYVMTGEIERESARDFWLAEWLRGVPVAGNATHQRQEIRREKRVDRSGRFSY